MNKLLLSLAFIFTLPLIYANPTPIVPIPFTSDASDCRSNGGVLLVGTVVTTPNYRSSSSYIDGVELSHSHFVVAPFGATSPSANYDVAADNLFASGYDHSQPNGLVPYPLTQIAIGSNIEACGLTYPLTQRQTMEASSAQQGIHFVHINNNAIIQGQTANGWLKLINPDGTLSANLEDNSEYLYLWQNNSRHHSF